MCVFHCSFETLEMERCHSKTSKNKPLVSQLLDRELNMWPTTKMRSPKVWSDSVIDSHLEHSNNFYYKDLFGHYSCVNTVEFSADGNYMISGGDDRRVFLWRIWDAIADPDYTPRVMMKEHNANIFCLSFDSQQERIYSGGNDEIVIVHNIETGDAIDVMSHMNDVHGISVNPTNHNIFASASDDIIIWDLRNSLNPQHVATGTGMFHGVMYNPVQSHMIATASSKNGVELYDDRQPLRRLCRFYPSYIMNSAETMCVRFNQAGSKILAINRKWPPVLYDIRSPYPQLLFDGDGYFNTCTLKHGSFAGQNDQFVISGSDNFYIYMWKIPDSVSNDSNQKNTLKQESVEFVAKPTQVLTGHRSIVNQVRFNNRSGIIASAGIEKFIRLWSPFIPLDGEKSIDSKESSFSREFYYYQDFLDNIDRPNSPNQDTNTEDIRLIAYFDSMLIRDINLDYSSSDDHDLRSYFSPHINDIATSSGTSDQSEDYSSVECVSDSESKFAIQKRIDFNFVSSNENNNILRDLNVEGQLDHLELVYAKRMHVRYLISVIDNITKQIENILPELRKILDESETTEDNSENDGGNNNNNKESKKNSKNLFVMLRKKRCPLHQYGDLYRNIQNVKRYKLLSWANRIIVEMFRALRSGTLFKKCKPKDNLKLTTIIECLEKKEQVDKLIRQLSTVEDRNLFDRKLHRTLSNLYKKVLNVAKLLNDIKAGHDPYRSFTREVVPPAYYELANFLFSDNENASSDSSDSINSIPSENFHLLDDSRSLYLDEHSDIEDSSISDSSDTSISMDDDEDQKKEDGNKKTEPPPPESSNGEISPEVKKIVISNNDTAAIASGSSPSTSSITNTGIEENVQFKKIDSRKRNYKRRGRRGNSKKPRRQ